MRVRVEPEVDFLRPIVEQQIFRYVLLQPLELPHTQIDAVDTGYPETPEANDLVPVPWHPVKIGEIQCAETSVGKHPGEASAGHVERDGVRYRVRWAGVV